MHIIIVCASHNKVLYYVLFVKAALWYTSTVYYKICINKGLCMKVYLLKDVQKIGFAGEILKVADGYAQNYLIPNKLAVQITADNEQQYINKQKTIEKRKEAIATETSMLAEKIKSLQLTLAKKMHDDDRLYGSVAPVELVDLLAQKGVKVSKSQIIFEKPIKAKGTFEVTVKLSSRLQPRLKLKIVPEHQ